MRHYKANYGTSYFFAHVYFIAILLPTLPMIDIILAIRGEAQLGSITLMGIGVCIALALFSAWMTFLFTCIGKLFSRKFTTVDQNTITHEGRTLTLDSVRYVTVYLPEISRNSSKPLRLTLWADNTHYCTIHRPALSLILHLRKRCHNARFDIDDLRGQIKWCLVGSLVFMIILILSILTSK